MVYVKTLITFLFLSSITYTANLIDALVTFQLGNRTVCYPTQDLFQIKQEPYYATGILVEPRFVNGRDCVLDTIELDFEASLANTRLVKNRTVIAVIHEEIALAQGCKTIVHTGIAADEYNSNATKQNGVYIDAVLFLLVPRNDLVPGSPYNLPYTANSASFPDGGSPVPLALLPVNDFSNVAAAQNANWNTPIVTWVQEEPGPWNEVFLSGAYLAYIYSVITIIAFFIVKGIMNFIRIAKSNDYPSKQHLAIFFCGLIACCCLCIQQSMGIYTALRMHLNRLIGTLFFVAYTLLFLQWHTMLSKLESSRHLHIFGKVIWTATIGIPISETIIYSFMMLPLNNTMKTILYAAETISLILRFVLMLGFIYHFVLFRLKRRVCMANIETIRVLDQLTLICALCILGNLLIFGAKAINLGNYRWRGIESEVAYQALYVFASLLRMIPLIFTLKFQVQRARSHRVVFQKSSIVSSHI